VYIRRRRRQLTPRTSTCDLRASVRRLCGNSFGSIAQCSGNMFPATQVPRASCRLAAAAAAAETKSALFKSTYTARARAPCHHPRPAIHAAADG
jgi:hypothetical protein